LAVQVPESNSIRSATITGWCEVGSIVMDGRRYSHAVAPPVEFDPTWTAFAEGKLLPLLEEESQMPESALHALVPTASLAT